MLDILNRLLFPANKSPLTVSEQASRDIQSAINGTGSLYDLDWGRTDIVFCPRHIIIRTLFVNFGLERQGIGRAVITTLQSHAIQTGKSIRLLTVKTGLESTCVKYGFKRIPGHFNDWEWSPL